MKPEEITEDTVNSANWRGWLPGSIFRWKAPARNRFQGGLPGPRRSSYNKRLRFEFSVRPMKRGSRAHATAAVRVSPAPF